MAKIDSPGFRRLKAHPDYDNIVKRTLAEQRAAVKAVAHPPIKGGKLHGKRPRKEGDYPKGKGK